MVSMDDEEWFDHYLGQLLVSKPATLGDVFSLARIIEARFDDQAALVAGTLAGLEANKVVNDGDDSESSGPVIPTSDSESSGKVEMKVLVDGKQDEAKVVKVVVVAVKQNIDEPDVEGNGVIGVGVNENNKGVQYSVSTLHVLILLLERLNDQYIKKKKMEAAIQRRIWDPGIKIYFRHHLEEKVVVKEWGMIRPRSLHRLEVVLISRYYPQGSYQLVLSLVCSLRASDSRLKKVIVHRYYSRTVHGVLSTTLFISTIHWHYSQYCSSGVYQESWIFSITEYFSLQNTPADQWVKIVGFNLEGAAEEWFQSMTRNGLITTWARFEESVRNCFGPSEYEDPNGVLSKLLQLGTVKDYQREFEKLMNRATDIPNSLLISYYIYGLKLHLQRELLVSKPITLGDVFLLAQIIEARFDDQAASVAGLVIPTSDSKSSGKVKVLNWVQQSMDIESIYDNDARDQVSELEMKVLVDDKQDEEKVVKVVVVAVKQNINEPDAKGNGVIGVGVNENNSGVQYFVS
ncbi:retrotransposon-related protein, partial [Tanacetum coccineum]